MHGVGIASLSHSYRPGGESALSGGQDTGGVMDVHARTRSEPDARAHSHGMPDVVPDGKGCCTTAGNRRGTAERLFSGAFSCVADLLVATC